MRPCAAAPEVLLGRHLYAGPWRKCFQFAALLYVLVLLLFVCFLRPSAASMGFRDPSPPGKKKGQVLRVATPPPLTLRRRWHACSRRQCRSGRLPRSLVARRLGLALHVGSLVFCARCSRVCGKAHSSICLLYRLTVPTHCTHITCTALLTVPTYCTHIIDQPYLLSPLIAPT